MNEGDPGAPLRPGTVTSRTGTAEGDRLRCVVAGTGRPRLLSELVPTFAGFGLAVAEQRRHETGPGNAADSTRRWSDTFDLVPQRRLRHPVGAQFDEALAAVLAGAADADGFNGLVLTADLTWRQVAVLRAYARYSRQAGCRFSQGYIEQALVDNPRVAAALVEVFQTRFDPTRYVGAAQERGRAADARDEELQQALQQVTSLDEDRILRTLRELLLATVRTSYFQRDAAGISRSYLSFKLEPRRLRHLPAPRPRAEIWVSSPRFEGVHQRFGAVARGGLRWSDRPEDFRTEVLGLAKAQAVKNALIVPAGAKGGFVCRRGAAAADRDARMAEGEACYRLFVSALLELTDDLVDAAGGHRVRPPQDTVRHDGDDPYLVVAADKGTAGFPDLANEVAVERGFWLGDAFASGGRTGYDHKALGITARGAWESVCRHFRELGRDPNTEDVTVIGIGDMSGDVFGNGMLLSEHIRLVAAFDHRHIFLDPDPDPSAAYRERQRLFALPRSSWADWNPALLSTGGGVHTRRAKAVTISEPVRRRLGLGPAVQALTPDELIRAILAAPVDLLWNGGIGTYVKARSEDHATVGDKANDGVRVNGQDLRCRVVTEGGNLGLTHLARVEYALAGGRVNTDAIDNSAGVDTSDREVNLKILLQPGVRSGALSEPARNALLASVQDDVADRVLADNYRQNLQLSAAEKRAVEALDRHATLIGFLEREGYLHRAEECLPDDVELAMRSDAGQGLTRPELCVLLAHSKRSLKDDLDGSDVPDDPYLNDELAGYFPQPVLQRSSPDLAGHPLRRGIITTCLVNDLVDHVGPGFVHRLEERTGAATTDAVRAYVVCRDVFGLPGVWAALRHTQPQLPAEAELMVLEATVRLLEHTAAWLLRHRRPPLDMGAEVNAFRQPVTQLACSLTRTLDESTRAFVGREEALLGAAGADPATAARTALLGPLAAAFDIVELARRTDRDPLQAAAVYYAVGLEYGLDTLRARISGIPVDSHWTSLAQAGLLDDLAVQQRRLAAAALLGAAPGTSATEVIGHWRAQGAGVREGWDGLLREVRRGETLRLPLAVVAVHTLRELATAHSPTGAD